MLAPCHAMPCHAIALSSWPAPSLYSISRGVALQISFRNCPSSSSTLGSPTVTQHTLLPHGVAILPLPLFFVSPELARTRTMAAAVPSSPRERKPSIGTPISQLQGPIGPGFSRPKHKRTATGFGAGDIKAVESSIPEHMREAYVVPSY